MRHKRRDPLQKGDRDVKIKTKKASRALESSDRGTVDSSDREAVGPSCSGAVEPSCRGAVEPVVVKAESSLSPARHQVSPGVRAQERMLLGDLA
jgi:hypothetical protein